LGHASPGHASASLRALHFCEPGFFCTIEGSSDSARGRHGSMIMIWLIALPDDKPSAQPWK
jgi:hypothetical protein